MPHPKTAFQSSLRYWIASAHVEGVLPLPPALLSSNSFSSSVCDPQAMPWRGWGRSSRKKHLSGDPRCGPGSNDGCFATQGGKEWRFSTMPHGFRPSAVIECLELVQEVGDPDPLSADVSRDRISLLGSWKNTKISISSAPSISCQGRHVAQSEEKALPLYRAAALSL